MGNLQNLNDLLTESLRLIDEMIGYIPEWAISKWKMDEEIKSLNDRVAIVRQKIYDETYHDG